MCSRAFRARNEISRERWGHGRIDRRFSRIFPVDPSVEFPPIPADANNIRVHRGREGMIPWRRYRFAIENSGGLGRKSALSISRFRTDELRTGEKKKGGRGWRREWGANRQGQKAERRASGRRRTIEKIIRYNTSRGNSTGACDTGAGARIND